MFMTLDHVKCTVSNCRYNKDKKCFASAIEINVDGDEALAPDQLHTQCHTFEKK